jgi:tetratricopeptide (TPR) repeat protein
VALASASYGLAVGARPSLLFGALILLAPWFHARKCDHGAPPSPRRRRLLVAALGPIALIGAGLALYNHARFGDIFEFGQRYQLAGDRQDAARHFGIDYVGFNFRLYFLSAAPWSAVFPFVRPVALPPAPFGHASAESALGILTNTPFALLAPLGAWLIGRDRRAATRPLRIGLAALAWWFAASAGVLLLFYGTVLRYQAEFHPALALLAAFGVLALEQRLAAATRLVRIGARTAWIGAALFSVAVSLLMNVVLRADEYNRQAVQAEAAGDLALAQTKLEAALRLQADHVAANGNFGQLLLARGDLAGATVRFHTALAREPGNLAARDGLGRALAAQNKPREAAEQFQAIIAAEPRNAFAQVSLATMLLQLGRAPEAVTHYETAIRLGLDSPAIRAALAQAREAAGAR